MALTVTTQSFDSLKPLWDRLLAATSTGSPFSAWDFQTIWYNILGQGAPLHICSISKGDDLIGIAPLLQGDKSISFVGSQDVCDYLDFIIQAGREREVLAALLAHLQALSWERMELISLREGSPTLAHLPELAEESGWRVEVVVQDACPQMPLPSDWEQYLARLSKKDRHELRRKLRRLQAADVVRTYLGSDLERDMAAFLDLHKQSNEDKAEFMTPRMEEFFWKLARTFVPQGKCGIYLMDLDGQPVSAAVCFFSPREALLYNSGFRRDCSYLSVGLLLKAYCIRHAIERGIPAFNFLRGNEPYKYHLGGEDHPVYNMTISR